MVDVICPPLSISSIIVSLWLAGCLAKSTLIGWQEYYGGGRGECRQTPVWSPANASIWPNAVSILAHRQRRWTTIETTLGRVFVFAGRAVRILIHAYRLCLVGTGSTVLCVGRVIQCMPSGGDIPSFLKSSTFLQITILNSTLTTSQGSDTVTSIFKCNSSNTIKSLRLLKMA